MCGILARRVRSAARSRRAASGWPSGSLAYVKSAAQQVLPRRLLGKSGGDIGLLGLGVDREVVAPRQGQGRFHPADLRQEHDAAAHARGSHQGLHILARRGRGNRQQQRQSEQPAKSRGKTAAAELADEQAENYESCLGPHGGTSHFDEDALRSHALCRFACVLGFAKCGAIGRFVFIEPLRTMVCGGCCPIETSCRRPEVSLRLCAGRTGRARRPL